MKHIAFAVVIGLGVLSTANYAHAAACANGVYRAGCTGPNGTAVVRKAPPVRKPVTCANGVYRAGCVGPNGAVGVRK
jgi:hypothetical protein